MLVRTAARGSNRRGAAMVEFAVILPLLLMFLMGIVEFGRLMMTLQIATTGSREGARYAAQADRSANDVRAYTRQYLAAASIPAEAITTLAVEHQLLPEDPYYTAATGGWVDAASLATVPQGRPVRVRLDLNFDRLTWIPSGLALAQGTILNGTTVMRKE